MLWRAVILRPMLGYDMRDRFCTWHCNRRTKNRSRICDPGWIKREEIFRARKAREAAEGPDQSKIEAGRRNAAKRALIQQEMPQSGG